MSIKAILYLITVPFVIYILDGVRINDIFKKKLTNSSKWKIKNNIYNYDLINIINFFMPYK